MAATSDLLTAMEDIDDVLAQRDVSGTSGTLQSRAIRALNHAQDSLEMLVAKEEDLFSEFNTITQTVDQEFSAATTGMKRLDAVWFLDATTSRPTYQLQAMRRPGSHRVTRPWPLLDVSTNTAKRPEGYWWERRNNRLYWDSDPDTTNSIRLIGFWPADDMTLSPDSTLAYPDEFIIPLAALAVRIFSFRSDDDLADLEQFGNTYLAPVIEQYKRAWKDQLGETRGHFPAW